MKKNVIKISCLIFVVLFFMATVLVYAADPHLELLPSSGSISTAGTNIEVKIDTGGQAAKSAKAVIKFDATKLEVSSITAGSFFDEVSHNIYNSTGQVVINANLSLGNSLETKTGTGVLATMNVKAKLSTGSANMTFDCTTGSSTDSGINNAVPTDIIVCASNVNGSYTLGAGASLSPGTSPVPTPSALPVAGSVGPTLSLLLLGTGLLLLSIPLFLFL